MDALEVDGVIGKVQRVPDERHPDPVPEAGWKSQPRRPSSFRPSPASRPFRTTRPRGLLLKTSLAACTSFQSIRAFLLESSRSSITFSFEAFEFSTPKGALHLNGNSIKGLAFDGERRRRGTVGSATPRISHLRQVPPPPSGSPGGSPDASD